MNHSETPVVIVAINVGNTRTGVGLFHGRELVRSFRVPNSEPDVLANEIGRVIDQAGEDTAEDVNVVFASVNDSVMQRIQAELQKRNDVRVHRVGKDLAIPIGRQLDPEAIVGDDRLINAAAAYDVLQQACVVIDAGTAVTVDFVDGQGTFHGGAIAPGCQMQLNGMHDHTAMLPEVKFVAPDPEPFGANTTQAMLHGVFYGVRGMVRHLLERYAEAYQAYPAVIATGGDAHVLFDGDELIEKIDDDLPLRGIAASCRLAIENLEEMNELDSDS